MNKHQVFTNVAIDISNLSKCVSMLVGCIAVNERGRIISSGVNGTASGFDNCCDVHTERGGDHTEWSSKYEIHAEMNCILDLARSSTSFKEVDFYVTHCPCSNCLKHIIGLKNEDHVKVKNIIYNEVYYKTSPELLQEQKDYCSKFNVNLLSINEILLK